MLGTAGFFLLHGIVHIAGGKHRHCLINKTDMNERRKIDLCKQQKGNNQVRYI